MQTLYKLLDDQILTKLIKRLSIKTTDRVDAQQDLRNLYKILKGHLKYTCNENMDTFVILIADPLKICLKDKHLSNVEYSIKILKLIISKQIINNKRYKEEMNTEMLNLCNELKNIFLVSFIENIYLFSNEEIIKFGLNSIFNCSLNEIFAIFKIQETILFFRVFKLYLKKLEKTKEFLNEKETYKNLIIPFINNLQSIKSEEEYLNIIYILNYFKIEDLNEIPKYILQSNCCSEIINENEVLNKKWNYLRNINVFHDSFYKEAPFLNEDLLIHFKNEINKRKIILKNKKLLSIFLSDSSIKEKNILLLNYVNNTNKETEIFDVFEFSEDILLFKEANQNLLNIFLNFVIKNKTLSFERIYAFENFFENLNFKEKLIRYSLFNKTMKSKEIKNSDFKLLLENLEVALNVLSVNFFKKNLKKLKYDFRIFFKFPNLMRMKYALNIKHFYNLLGILNIKQECYLKRHVLRYKDSLKGVKKAPIKYFTMFYFLNPNSIKNILFYAENINIAGNEEIQIEYPGIFNFEEAFKYFGDGHFLMEHKIIERNITRFYEFLSSLKMKKSLFHTHEYLKYNKDFYTGRISIFPFKSKLLRNILRTFSEEFTSDELNTVKGIIHILNNKEIHFGYKICIKRESFEVLSKNIKRFLFALIFEKCKLNISLLPINLKSYENEEFFNKIFSKEIEYTLQKEIFQEFSNSLVFQNEDINIDSLTIEEIFNRAKHKTDFEKYKAFLCINKLNNNEIMLDYAPKNKFILNSVLKYILPEIRLNINPHKLSNKSIKENELSMEQFISDKLIYNKTINAFCKERERCYLKTISELSNKINKELRANYLFCKTENPESLENEEAFNLILGSFHLLLSSRNKFWIIFLESVFMQSSINLLFYIERQISKHYKLTEVFNYKEYINYILTNEREREIQLFAFLFPRIFKNSINSKLEINGNNLILEEASKINLNNVNIKTVKTTNNVSIKIEYEIKNDVFEMSLAVPMNLMYHPKFKTIPNKNAFNNSNRDFMDQKLNFLLTQTNKFSEVLNLWKINMDNKMGGIGECGICYFIVSVTKEIPTVECKECSIKYHRSCLNHWRVRSKENRCALCRLEMDY